MPAGLAHPAFVATALTPANAALDYAAYMASPDVIRVHGDGRWPVAGFTLEEDRRQAAAHHAAHEARRAFTFLLLDPSRSESLGCLYLNPLREYLGRAGATAEILSAIPPTTAMVTFWTRQDQEHAGLAETVAAAVSRWLVTDWPFALCLFRILPSERVSLTALERLQLQPVELRLPGKAKRYLWFRAS